jgi:hypothetical protein
MINSFSNFYEYLCGIINPNFETIKTNFDNLRNENQEIRITIHRIYSSYNEQIKFLEIIYKQNEELPKTISKMKEKSKGENQDENKFPNGNSK